MSPLDCVYDISTTKCRVAEKFISEWARNRAVAKCHEKLHAHAHELCSRQEVYTSTSLLQLLCPYSLSSWLFIDLTLGWHFVLLKFFC